ncbi:MAG: NAD(P)/FAD-dependent oxidoreductase [Nitrospirae bacterium]|nr:NAD(P)/FAD-dependent oxidoreductase [Nitrospirota bacterium]
MDYDVIIVGAGPAGIFSAIELLQKKRDTRILIIEKGNDLEKRICPMRIRDISCKTCPECALLSGWGGAGAFSDGKLNLSPEIGGFLSRYISIDELETLINYVDDIYKKYGAPETIYGGSSEEIKEIESLAIKNNLRFIPSRIRHIGTDKCKELLRRIEEDIYQRVEILFDSEVEKVIVRKGKVVGVKLKDGVSKNSRFVILAPGREGSRWLERESKRLHLTLYRNPVDIGLRIELLASVFEPLTRITYEPKLIFDSGKFHDRVRTFCVNPYGEVVREYLKGIWTVNGHSYSNRNTENTNFALLVSTSFTEPFDEPILYGRYIAGLANLLGNGVILQRLGDLRQGRRSTHERIARGLVMPTLKDATPGDLSFVMPFRYLSGILEMLEALDKITPGVNSDHTLLYGAEVKFYSRYPKLTESLETEIKNLFAVGDGAGVSRGLIQASTSGVIAAREVVKRMV